MSNVKFENHRITTETLIYTMKGIVDLRTVFFLTPINYEFLWSINIDRGKKKIKLPKGSKPGSCLLIKYGEDDSVMKCGFNDKKNAFKNAITISISTSLKNNNIKICPQRIQLTGAKSFEDGKEAVCHYIDHVFFADNLLREMNCNPAKRDSTLEWLKQETRGPPYLVYYDDIPEVEYYLKRPTEKEIDEAASANKIDPRFARLLLNKVRDYRQERHERIDYMFDDEHSQYVDFLRMIPSKKCVILEYPYYIESMSIGTININYPLGFLVDRKMLDKLIYKYKGFVSRFMNSIEDKCEIHLACPDLEPSGSKKKRPVNTILVYRSGAVTQSGPRPDKMKIAYNLFNEFMQKYRAMLEIDPNLGGKPTYIKIKYHPYEEGKVVKPTRDLTMEGPIVINTEPRYPEKQFLLDIEKEIPKDIEIQEEMPKIIEIEETIDDFIEEKIEIPLIF